MISHAIAARQGLRTLNGQGEVGMIITGAISISLSKGVMSAFGRCVHPAEPTAFPKRCLSVAIGLSHLGLFHHSLSRHLHSLARTCSAGVSTFTYKEFFSNNEITWQLADLQYEKTTASLSSPNPASYAPAKCQTLIPYTHPRYLRSYHESQTFHCRSYFCAPEF
jgi:hypothetical protein